MKVFNSGKVMTSMIILLISSGLMAQQGNEPGKFNAGKQKGQEFCKAIPDLTPEQEKKLKEIRTSNLKEMNTYSSEMKVKRAELQLLQTTNNPDINKINAKIDEIGKIKTDMAKKKAAQLQKVRSLLNEEQRIHFDARKGKAGPGMNRGRQYNQGMHQGAGRQFKPKGM